MQTRHDLIVEPIGLNVDALPRPLNWPELFGNDHPVELEVGMGKGTFLTDQANARKDTNFFGIEYARWYWRYASDRLRRRGCLNARTVRAEAAYFLHEFVADASISVLHVYFPDPWPKKRHHKRRLIQPKFMPTVMRVLRPLGRLQIVTDHAGYFEQIQQVVRDTPLVPVDYIGSQLGSAGEFVGTNFERKYRREGRPFFGLAVMKQR